jgi:hypothetical protein
MTTYTGLIPISLDVISIALHSSPFVNDLPDSYLLKYKSHLQLHSLNFLTDFNHLLTCLDNFPLYLELVMLPITV